MKSKISLSIIFIIIFFSQIFAQDFILIHGWQGDGTVWNGSGVKQLLQNEFNYNSIRQPSLGGHDYSQNQSTALKNYLNSYAINNATGIAYSMGGINSRYYLKSQYSSGQTQRISKLYTIGSPHLGTKLANNKAQAIRLLLVGAESILYPGGYLDDPSGIIQIHGWSLPIADLAYIILYNGISYGLLNNFTDAALTDLAVGSPAVNYINSTTSYENSIIKVGIAGTEIDPVLYRMGAHILGASENYIIDAATYTENFKLLQLIGAYITYAETPTQQNLDNMIAHVASYSFFRDINKNWKEVILEAAESDGVVSKTSQIYPNYNAQFYADFASHMEQKDHYNVVNNLRLGLSQFGHMPPPVYASISGPTYLASGVNGTWNCSASGGRTPYNYQWYYMYPASPLVKKPGVGYWIQVGSNSPSLTRSDNETFQLKCVVTDALSTVVTSNIITVNIGMAKQSVENLSDISAEFALEQNYPNPFNPTTNIRFSLPHAEHVTLKIYDMLGVEVATLVDEQLNEGFHNFEWNAENVSSGIYVYKIFAGQYTDSKKLVVMK